MKQQILTCVLSLLALSPYLSGKEIFSVEHIEPYLGKDNPYVYTAIGQQYIEAARIQTAQGSFDTRVSAAYDKKDYPLSTSEFSDIVVSKPIQSGPELIAGYRQAEGTQEYNNIKTGDEGEFRVGVKVPVVSLLNNMNERKFRLDSTKINADRSSFEAQDNLRNLYAHIVTSYYRLLYHHELIKLEEQLLNKAEKRDRFIQQRVRSGDLPEVSILESQQQIINREQRVLTTRRKYRETLQTFLKYLNLPHNEFDARYELPSLTMLKKEKVRLQDLINKALTNRPDLMALESEGRRLNLETAYNDLSKYPTFDLFAYGVHDVEYGEGVKVGFTFNIPLERRSYEGKRVEIQKGMTQVQERKNQLLLELKTNLSNLVYSLDVVNENIELGNKETKIAETLEEVENKKYKVGSSDLFQVNQREIIALEVKKKQLEYYLNALIIEREIKREIGESITL